jgi:uncharacterized protein (DUF924 family)
MIDPKRVIQFWFRHEPLWFAKDAQFDDLIRQEFENLYESALIEKLDSWAEAPESLLSLILVLDQFPRNMFRHTPKAFSGDKKAQRLTRQGVELGFDQHLPTHTHRQFFYMPLMHSEVLADQELSIKMYSQLKDGLTLNFAQAHRDIIATFGRFPHRNTILGRETTAEEEEFLKKPGSSF